MPILSTEKIENPNPNEENREISNIDLFNNPNPNLIFNPSPKKLNPIFQVNKKGKFQFTIYPFMTVLADLVLQRFIRDLKLHFLIGDGHFFHCPACKAC